VNHASGAGHRAVVIGAQGQLGQDLMRALGDGAVGVTHQDVDVTDGVALLQLLQAHRPAWVLNTAAFHRVDDCEANPALAMAVNVLGALNAARSSRAIGARHVFFSTDYVFGGGPPRSRNQPRLESEATRPLNVYGVSKAAGEQLVLQSHPEALVIRSAGLYGTETSRKGWTFPELMLHLAATQPVVRVVDDQVLSPTFTADLADATLRLMRDGSTGLVHVVNEGECSWFEFAAAIFELTGTQARLEPQSTGEAARRASRPPYSALGTERPEARLRCWREALADYLTRKGRR
jgi:dTDP-4-dehydrorhamnose reductase